MKWAESDWSFKQDKTENLWPNKCWTLTSDKSSEALVERLLLGGLVNAAPGPVDVNPHYEPSTTVFDSMQKVFLLILLFYMSPNRA